VAAVFGPECERPTTSDDRDGLSVEELVEYCQIQAGLLAGRTVKTRLARLPEFEFPWTRRSSRPFLAT